MRSSRRTLVVALALIASLIPIAASGVASAATPVFINEIHYDNTGTDEGEAVEVAGPATTDLSNWDLVLYNGSNQQVYNTIDLAGVIPDQGGGFGTVFVSLPTNGLQNGAPDGIALVDDGSLVQFLSYEGAFMGSGGPADGVMSTDIGVSESSSTAVGDSLQLGGTGTMYEDFAWESAAPSTFGAVNTNQVFDEPPPPGDGSSTLVVNEIDYDQPGSDTAEFLEILNVSDGPIGLDGWTVELVNGTGGGATIYDTIALPDVALAAGDYFVVCADAAATPNCDLEDINSIQNGSPDAVAIRNGEVLIDTVSYEGNTGDPYTETSGEGLTDSSSIGFVGISRFPDGTDTDRNNVDLASTVCITPGEANTDATEGCAPIREVKIHEVQGPGDASPIEGERVIVEGVVVGDEETFDSLAGFFVQEEDYDVDDDPMTSEGVFVFNFSNDDVDLGDVVRVEGTVEERFGNTQLTDFVVVEVLDVPARVATPTTIEFPLDFDGQLEWVEGMAVTFPQGLVVTEYFNYDRFGEIVIGLPSAGADRPMNPTAVFPPGSPEGIALAEFNALSRITIDDGQSDQNPDFNVHPIFRDEFTLTNYFRGGDVVTGVTGPIYFSFGQHKLYPNGYDAYDATDRPEQAPTTFGFLKIATLNALNYFLTLDDHGDVCGPNQDQGCRGSDNEIEFERQRDKLLESLLELDADIVGLVELENTPGVSPLADLVDGLNERLRRPVYDYVDTGVVGTDVIKVGYIYKRATVTPYRAPAVLDTPEFLDPNDTGDDRNRAALAQTFVQRGRYQRVTVVLNHFKSKGSPCGAGDDSPFAGSCNLTRTLAAEELARWIETDPTRSADPDFLILGDLNSYDKETPIDALKDAGYQDLIADYLGENAYTFVFSGQWGYLDYAMSNENLSRQVIDVDIWQFNADEPDIFDKDTSFKSPSQIALFEGDKAYRSSDHDAVIVGLNLLNFRFGPPRWR